MILQKTQASKKAPGTPPVVAPVKSFVPLVILMVVIGDGKLMANLTLMWAIRNGNGGVQGCWADAPIIGGGFLCALAQRILSTKVLMALAMTGPSAMKM